MTYVVRQLRRSPGFFAIAILLLALGVGAATQVFTLVNALLLRPLPVHDPQSLVQLFEIHSHRPPDPYFDYPFYRQLQHTSATLTRVSGEFQSPRSLDHNGQAERIQAAAVTDNFFDNLGIPPLLGKLIASGDTHVAVLSHPYWSRAFARSPAVLGQTLRLDGKPFTIIGVSPESFTGTNIESAPDLWFPYLDILDFSRTPKPDINNYVIKVIARLKPGVSVGEAQQATAALWNRYLETTTFSHRIPSDYLQVRSIALGLSPLRDQAGTSLLLLLGGTGLLLLIVCANVGGLLLFRVTGRERETAVRIALGASRFQVLRPWLIESAFVATCGTAIGVLLASATMPFLMHWMPPARGMGFDPAETSPLTLQPHLDFSVAAFSFSICLLSALLCTLAPAWKLNRRDVNQQLKTNATDKRNRLFQSGLIAFQIALCTTLLVSAGLIIRSLANLQASNPGFDRDHVAVFSIDPHTRGFDGQQNWSFQQRLLSEIQTVPGVEHAALADRALMRGIGLGISIVFPGQKGDGIINTSVNSVTPDYFSVMGIHFVAGSNLRSGVHPHSAVVNQAFVEKFLHGRNPLGAQFSNGREFTRPEYQITGVVSDTRYRSLREIPPPIFYYDGFGPDDYPGTFILHVSTHGEPNAILQPVRKLIARIDPQVPIFQVATLSQEIETSLWQEHLLATLTFAFGAFALILSGVGLYGLLAYFVARNRREIGLRIAVGASTSQVTALVLSRVVTMLTVGLLAGIGLSLLAGTAARSLLYGVSLIDPKTIASAVLLLLTVGICGAIVPALSATRIDPATILRDD